MRIAQITYNGFGGLGSVVFSLISADSLKEHSWSVGFIGDAELDSTYKENCTDLGVDFATIQYDRKTLVRGWSKLFNWLCRTKPEIVICHSITAILPCKAYTVTFRKTLIAVEHTANQVKSRSNILASYASMICANRIVTLTEEYRLELKRLQGIIFTDRKVTVIPNGIDTNVFTPNTTFKFNNCNVIKLGMAARFIPSKRHDILVNTLRVLNSHASGHRFVLEFAGSGEEMQRVRDLVYGSGLADQVCFLGLLPERQIADWLRELNIYVHATDAETLSTSLLQAMATELPVVASDVSGVRNLLGSGGEFGCVVRNTPHEFSKAVMSLVVNTGIASTMAIRARKQVVQRYSNHAMLREYIKIGSNV